MTEEGDTDDAGAHWMVFVDRRGGRIVLVGQYDSTDYTSAILSHEASDGNIRVWRNGADELVAAEATIAKHTDDGVQQLSSFRRAVERLQEVADAESAWFEPDDLIRMIPFDDDGALSFITYGSGRPRTATEREHDAEEAFMEALDQARKNAERKRE